MMMMIVTMMAMPAVNGNGPRRMARLREKVGPFAGKLFLNPNMCVTNGVMGASSVREGNDINQCFPLQVYISGGLNAHTLFIGPYGKPLCRYYDSYKTTYEDIYIYIYIYRCIQVAI